MAAVLALVVAPSQGAARPGNGAIFAAGATGGSGSPGLLLGANQRGGDKHRVTHFPVGSIAASPRGGRLALATRHGLYLTDATGRNRHRISRMGNRAFGGSVAFAPGGQELILEGPVSRGGIGARLYSMRLDGSHRHLAARVRGYMPRWSPDGKEIAFIRPSPKGIIASWGEIDAVRPGSGKRRVLYRPPSRNEAVSWFDWSPDGRQLVVDVEDNGMGCEGAPPPCYQPPADELGIAIVDRHGRLVRHFDQEGSLPIWSPDGRRIAYTASSGLAMSVLTMPATGGAPRRAMSFPGYVQSLAWMPR